MKGSKETVVAHVFIERSFLLQYTEFNKKQTDNKIKLTIYFDLKRGGVQDTHNTGSHPLLSGRNVVRRKRRGDHVGREGEGIG